MGAAPLRVRVLIPTTSGPVELQSIVREPASLGRSVACIDGRAELASIAPAYADFVAHQTGLIERNFGHPAFRIDFSGPIDAGQSWQLAVLAGHALADAGRLATEQDEGAQITLWASGSVRVRGLEVGPVEAIGAKLEASAARLREELRAGRQIILAVPEPAAGQLRRQPETATLLSELLEGGAVLLAVSDANELLDAVGLPRIMGLGSPPDNAAPPAASGRSAHLRLGVLLATLALATLGAIWHFTGAATSPGAGNGSPAERRGTGGPIGPSFRDCPICPVMIPLGPGAFRMGSPDWEAGRASWEGPQVERRIEARFAIGKYEVSVAEFSAFEHEVGKRRRTPCRVPKKGLNGEPRWQESDRPYVEYGIDVTPDQPVLCINWHDAMAYASWLGTKTGKAYRLPSEAEWEYAARAGTISRFSFGDEEARLCQFGNVANVRGDFPLRHRCGDSERPAGPIRIGLLKANPWGLHDVHGNAYEWVADCWAEDLSKLPEGAEPYTGGEACEAGVIRGGGWSSFEARLRSAWRLTVPRQRRTVQFGFRVAISLQR